MQERNFYQPELPLVHTKEGIEPQKVAWVMVINTTKLDEEILILAARRVSNGKITFPGGKIEPGEKPSDGVIREVLEETGLNITEDEIFCATENGKPIRFGNYEAHPYVAFGTDKMVDDIFTRETKQGEWQWFTLGQLYDEVLLGNLPKEFINKYWIDFILENHFEITTNYPTTDLPASFMYKCQQYQILADYNEMKKNILKDTRNSCLVCA